MPSNGRSTPSYLWQKKCEGGCHNDILCLILDSDLSDCTTSVQTISIHVSLEKKKQMVVAWNMIVLFDSTLSRFNLLLYNFRTNQKQRK